MKLVKWTDRNGYRRAALVKNDQGEIDGIHGIQVAPPDLDSLDWNACKLMLHNALVDADIYDWQDVQMKQKAFESALSIFRRWVVSLYREGGNKSE